MNRLTNEQRLQIIELYYQNSSSVKRPHRALLPIYGQFGRPTEGDIFFLPKMEELDMPDMWFQQDGVTCHTARATIVKLRAAFGEQFISRSGPVNWPPRSCDLTPLDFFLCGYVKAHVYMDKSAMIDALEANIEAFIREIPADMLERVCQNWTLRIGHLQRSRG